MKKLIPFIILLVVGCLFWKSVRSLVERCAAPSYSTCEKCGRPWKFVKEYTIWYNDRFGTFAVCEECWNNSTLAELKEYYTDVYKDQLRQDMPDDHYVELMDSVESEFKRTHLK
jgi:hypothetical protein